MNEKIEMDQGADIKRETVECFRSFFSGELEPRLGLNALGRTYTWPVPKQLADEFGLKPTKAKEPSYGVNVELKWKLHDRWTKALLCERLALARHIITVWGGIRANKAEKLQRFVEMAESESPQTPIDGVASYSKLLAIAQPERYAIYDARVAVSLNAIQFLSNHAGLAFPYLQGRNKVVGHAGAKVGFSQDEKYSKGALINLGWEVVQRRNAYESYLRLLNAVQSKMPGNWKLYDFEMVLFSQAEEIIGAVKCGTQQARI